MLKIERESIPLWTPSCSSMLQRLTDSRNYRLSFEYVTRLSTFFRGVGHSNSGLPSSFNPSSFSTVTYTAGVSGSEGGSASCSSTPSRLGLMGDAVMPVRHAVLSQ